MQGTSTRENAQSYSCGKKHLSENYLELSDEHWKTDYKTCVQQCARFFLVRSVARVGSREKGKGMMKGTPFHTENKMDYFCPTIGGKVKPCTCWKCKFLGFNPDSWVSESPDEGPRRCVFNKRFRWCRKAGNLGKYYLRTLVLNVGCTVESPGRFKTKPLSPTQKDSSFLVWDEAQAPVFVVVRLFVFSSTGDPTGQPCWESLGFQNCQMIGIIPILPSRLTKTQIHSLQLWKILIGQA